MVRKILLAVMFCSSLLLVSSAYAQTAEEVGVVGDWTIHTYKDPKKRICFISSQPKDTLPKNVNRGIIVFYISHWPKHKVKHEISVDVGYPLKKGSQPTAVIGSETFKFIIKSDKAFVETPAQEKKMLDALKRGSVMVLTGVSSRGTKTTDRYSLTGLSAALQKLDSACK